MVSSWDNILIGVSAESLRSFSHLFETRTDAHIISRRLQYQQRHTHRRSSSHETTSAGQEQNVWSILDISMRVRGGAGVSATASATRTKRQWINENNKYRKNDEGDASSWRGAGSALSSLVIRNNKARGGETPNTPLYKRIPLPWPLTLIKKDYRQYEEEQLTKSGNRSAMSILLSYCQARATIGLRQMKEVSGDVSYHLPPAAPPLLLLTLWPGTQMYGEKISKRLLFSSPFVRKIALATLGITILTWAQCEWGKRQNLTPLPLLLEGRHQYSQDFRRMVLPPFLPEELPPLLQEEIEEIPEPVHIITEDIDEEEDELFFEEANSPVGAIIIQASKAARQMKRFYRSIPRLGGVPTALQKWKRTRELHLREMEEIYREAVLEELLEIQKQKHAIKNSKKGERNKGRRWGLGKRNEEEESETATNVDVSSSVPLGYALVTGASRGIGRALAVELARWEFPLILVARDLEKLKEVAHEIETCYGVKCCVIQADLSEPDAAENIYKVTRNAGLTVDVLVNNAGICTHGEAVDMELDTMKQIVQVNAGSVATLSHLYGRDMKANKRGRILFVSSVMGAVPAGPQVATYAATKAFEKTLSISMGRELANYGVGVTCLVPGAVGGTTFRQASNSEEAVCWKIPFYPLAAPDVAGAGVRALLSGESEVCPGWMNRSFLRVMQPMIPQRLTTSIVEFFWNPLTVPVSRMASPIKDEEIDSPLSTPLDGSRPNDSQSISVEPPRELELPTTNPDGDMIVNVIDTSENNMETMEIEIVGIKDDEKPVRATQDTEKADHSIHDMPSEPQAHLDDSHKEAMEDLFISEF
eukprot:scaffold55289_cov53-Attheya_sp.AAC.2